MNPCGFAMLPAYLLLVVRGAADRQRTSPLGRVGRALGATAGMALGFLTVFGVVRSADHLGGHDGAAIPAVCDGGDRRCACRAWDLVAVGSGVDALTPRPLGPRWAPKRGRGRDNRHVRLRRSAMRSPRCRARSGRFWRSPPPAFGADRLSAACSIYLAYVAGLTLVVGVLASPPRRRVRRWPIGCGESCRWSTGSAACCWCWSGCMWAITASTSCGC